MSLKYLRISLFLLTLSLLNSRINAQTDTTGVSAPATPGGTLIDEVIAIVGNKMVLMSEVELQYAQFISKGNYGGFDVKCLIADQLILSKMLLYHAILDSVEVKDDQIEKRMDYSMEGMIEQFGSQEKMEAYYGKTVLEWREELRPLVKDKMLMEAMRGKLLGNVTVSPAEIKAYFESFPADSLPYMNAEVEYAQIVRQARYSDEAKAECKKTLEDLRKRVIEKNEDFSTLAVLYSQDKTSAKMGGELGYFNRVDLVPEFSAPAFRLKPGEVSQVVETKFGFHLIQMIDRKGDQMNCRHILIRPYITDDDEKRAINFLDSVSSLILADSMTFSEAAEKFSDETETKQNGGIVPNMQTGNSRFEVDQLEGSLFFQLDQLQKGDISKPLPYFTSEGKKAFRILMLRERTKPHKANMTDDYQYWQSAASDEKSERILTDWVNKKLASTYLSVNEAYKTCPVIKKHWFNTKNQ